MVSGQPWHAMTVFHIVFPPLISIKVSAFYFGGAIVKGGLHEVLIEAVTREEILYLSKEVTICM